jgi:hypothetical protein
MAKDYKSIFIPEEVIFIVDQYGAAFVTDAKNANSIETGRNWASGYNYSTKATFTPEEYTYTNGQFKVRIANAAGHSCQGGKLSFWSCYIITPDNKEFKVGINAEMLCELILYNTFVNGECSEYVLFGTKSGQSGLYTTNMPSYQEYLTSAKIREDMKSSKTVKYNVGEEVRTLTDAKIYLGTLYKYFDVELLSHGSRYGSDDVTVTIYTKPKLIHAFADQWETKLHISQYTFMDKKPPRLRTGKTREVAGEIENWLKDTRDTIATKLQKEEVTYYLDYLLLDLQFGLENKMIEREAIKNRLETILECYRKKNNYYAHRTINIVVE